MTDAHRRKKNPELVRMQLVESARKLALENGLGSVGVDAVATDAGVTKGGLFHHFPSKQALIEAVFQYMLDEFGTDLDARMAADPESYGRFTRAYVLSVFDVGTEDQWYPLWMSTLTDPKLRQLWGAWFNAQLARYEEYDLLLENARFAADGIWLGHMFGVTPHNAESFRHHLIDMTRPSA